MAPLNPLVNSNGLEPNGVGKECGSPTFTVKKDNAIAATNNKKAIQYQLNNINPIMNGINIENSSTNLISL